MYISRSFNFIKLLKIIICPLVAWRIYKNINNVKNNNCFKACHLYCVNKTGNFFFYVTLTKTLKKKVLNLTRDVMVPPVGR